ncbi:hypothetical protein O181_092702, partial [Austropuccinia psidii MF-1]|nr:hypothetical protein [Austropuccinia psidii MF-1]
ESHSTLDIVTIINSLKEKPYITKGWNTNRKFKLLDKRAARIRLNQATILRLTRSKSTRLPSGFKPFRHQQISHQESPLFTIPGSFQEKTRIKRKKQEFFQPEEERVIPNDIEAFGLGERSTKDPEISVDTSDGISSPTARNIMLTKNEHIFVAPESNIKSNSLWFKMLHIAGKK